MAKKRPPPALNSHEFSQLRDSWYKKLKKAGFVDIEGGRDLNKSAAQTFRQSSRNSVLLWDFSLSDDSDEHAAALKGWNGYGLAEHARFEFTDRVTAYANKLRNKRHRELLLLVLEKGMAKARKELRMSVKESLSIWQATMEKLGLPNDTGTGGGVKVKGEPKQPQPGPVRILSAAERAKLQAVYKQPKDIKDKTDE